MEEGLGAGVFVLILLFGKYKFKAISSHFAPSVHPLLRSSNKKVTVSLLTII